MKNLVLGALGSLSAVLVSSTAYAGDELEVSASVDYVTEYVFRGVSFARNAVQPGVEASISGFTVGAWYSEPVGDTTSDSASSELDLYASYGFFLSEIMSVDIGATVYHYPESDGGVFDFGEASTFEVYGKVGFDTVLQPGLTAYYDIYLEAFTIEGGLSHSFPINDKASFDLSGTLGHVQFDGAGSYDYQSASAGVSYAVTDDISVYVEGNVVLSSEDTLNFKVDGNDNPFVTSDGIGFLSMGISTGF